jgi:hypothetical protein
MQRFQRFEFKIVRHGTVPDDLALVIPRGRKEEMVDGSWQEDIWAAAGHVTHQFEGNGQDDAGALGGGKAGLRYWLWLAGPM